MHLAPDTFGRLLLLPVFMHQGMSMLRALAMSDQARGHSWRPWWAAAWTAAQAERSRARTTHEREGLGALRRMLR